MPPESISYLDLARVRLEVAAEGFAPSPRHWVPDLVALGYLDEMRHNADAVRALVDREEPLHAIPSARSAFEAAQNLLLLTTSEDLDYAGALAYVYGIEKDHFITAQHPEVMTGVPAAEGGIGWNELAHAELAETWENLSPGQGRLIGRAQEELRKRGNRTPDNWAGVNPATELGKRLPRLGIASGADGVDVGTTLRRGYRVLCRDTHPRTSVRPLSVTRTPEGHLNTQTEHRDLFRYAHTSAALVGSALVLGAAGLTHRRRRTDNA